MLGAAWSTCLDIGGSHAGVVSATMNTSGQIGSVLSPLMVTFLLKRFGDWNLPLFVMGGLFLVGAVAGDSYDPPASAFLNKRSRSVVLFRRILARHLPDVLDLRGRYGVPSARKMSWNQTGGSAGVGLLPRVPRIDRVASCRRRSPSCRPPTFSSLR